MRISIRGKVLLVGACILAGSVSWGQQVKKASKPALSGLDVAILYNPSLASQVAGNRFWMQGGSGQVHYEFWRGVGLVAELSGWHTGNINNSGVSLNLKTFTFGPRYTWTAPHQRYSVFAQALAGVADGTNSLFPSSGGATTSATSAAVKLGGGVNWTVSPHVSIRAIEADWLRTELPNATTSVQNNLCLGAGIIYRFGK